jgi:ubiquinone/menaquinone biosynthesis C-methylase UbiE
VSPEGSSSASFASIGSIVGSMGNGMAQYRSIKDCARVALDVATIAHHAGVVHYYDTHPINEHEILRKVAAKGIDLARLTENELKDFDQDHYGGFDATDALATAADIHRPHSVLDVCSGLGGPARWLAYRIGCRVTGLDLTGSRVVSARRLTEQVGLTNLVAFVRGNATAMPLPSATFDRVVGQEAWVHIDDKRALLGECRRVLKPGGVLAFTDIVSCMPLTPEESSQMAAEMQFPSIVTAQHYLDLLPQAGFSVERYDDLSSGWRDILVDRLEMYRSLRDTTVERFGEAHFAKWDRMYSAFVGLYVAGKLGGARIVARGEGVRL